MEKNLRLGDNITMPTPIEKPFWLMLVHKGVQTISESFEDVDMNEWTTWDVVVRGY